MAINRTRLTEWIGNGVMAAIYVFFAWRYWHHFARTGDVSSLLYAFFESVLVYFFLFRKPPKETSPHFLDWLFAFIGTTLPMLIQPSAGWIQLNWAWVVLQSAGVLASLVALLSLNRSFGFVPANRGVKTGGFYRVVRHPLYATYCINIFFFVMQHLNPSNVLLFIAHIIVQVTRIDREEEILLRDAQYQAYAANTRWRLMPGLW